MIYNIVISAQLAAHSKRNTQVGTITIKATLNNIVWYIVQTLNILVNTPRLHINMKQNP